MTDQTPAEPEVVTPSLPEVASVFARYANTTFGGGSATIAVLREQLVAKRSWLREQEFELDYALSRLTPGILTLLAFCTAAGWTRRRWLGAIVALLASSLPCSLLVLLVTAFYEQLQGSSWFQAALGGALAAAQWRSWAQNGGGVRRAAPRRPRPLRRPR